MLRRKNIYHFRMNVILQCNIKRKGLILTENKKPLACYLQTIDIAGFFQVLQLHSDHVTAEDLSSAATFLHKRNRAAPLWGRPVAFLPAFLRPFLYGLPAARRRACVSGHFPPYAAGVTPGTHAGPAGGRPPGCGRRGRPDSCGCDRGRGTSGRPARPPPPPSPPSAPRPGCGRCGGSSR